METRKFGPRGRSQYFCIGPSMTKQSHTDECNINLIMKRFERTGVLEHVTTYSPQWGDFSDTPSSYSDAINQVQAANEMFLSLPSKIRARFDNDAGAYIDFVQNPANAEELNELGLTKLAPKGSPRPEAPKAKGGGKPAESDSDSSPEAS